MEYSDEDLMDYADSRLDEKTSTEMEAVIAADPALLERVEEFRSSFVMASIADDFAQSTVPSLDEIEAMISEREMAVQPEPQSYSLLAYLRGRILVALVSLSLTFAGGVAATVGFVAWRVQQALVGFQTTGSVLMRQGALVTRGPQADNRQAVQPIWYGAGPLVFNIEVLEQLKSSSGLMFERRLGYLKDDDSLPFGSALRVNYRIDSRKFLDAQGFWCLIFGSCEETGLLSLDIKSGKGSFGPFLAPTKVTPGELVSLVRPIVLVPPVGTDKIRIKFKFAGQVVERSVSVRARKP